MSRLVPLATTTAVLLSMAAPASAALVNRGGGMIYDTVSNVTWLADTNYALTSGYVAANGYTPPSGASGFEHLSAILADGKMALAPATKWADELVYAGFSDWRLPTLTPSSSGLGGEFGELLVNQLGMKFNESILNQVGDTDAQKANASLFTNLMEGVYWTSSASTFGEEFTVDLSAGAGGNLGHASRGPGFAWAVRTGDVGQQSTGNPVPEPGMLSLLATAAVALVAVRRRPRTA